MGAEQSIDRLTEEANKASARRKSCESSSSLEFRKDTARTIPESPLQKDLWTSTLWEMDVCH